MSAKTAPGSTDASWSRSPNKMRSEEHTSELQSPCNLVCRLLLEKKKKNAVTAWLRNKITNPVRFAYFRGSNALTVIPRYQSTRINFIRIVKFQRGSVTIQQLLY